MRWVVTAVRVLFSLLLISGALIGPVGPVWQIVGGAAYIVGVLMFISALDDRLDMVDLTLYGISADGDGPLSPKRLFERAIFVFLFWFIAVALGLVLFSFPVAWPISQSRGPGFFLAGTLIGVVMYLAAVGWYRKSTRRRYGY